MIAAALLLWLLAGAVAMTLWRQAWTRATGLPGERKWHRLIAWGSAFTLIGFAAVAVLIAVYG